MENVLLGHVFEDILELVSSLLDLSIFYDD